MSTVSGSPAPGPKPSQNRAQASILHLDLDAFFAAVEQRDKPSLRGKPVVVGGVGGRGVVATASYEARKYGVRSAMSTREARARCPHAAFLSGRFPAYRETSERVMSVLRSRSPLVEPLSLDEAFVDLEASELHDFSYAALERFARELIDEVATVTGGLTGSIGIGTSKFIAKVASDLEKPAGLVIVPAGTELDLLRPMAVTVIPGVGPATAERLRRAGITTVAQLEEVSLEELVRLVGKAHGHGLHQLARAQDSRAVEPVRETKSISVEGTYDTDLTDRVLMQGLLTRQAGQVAERLRANGFSGRTVSLKVRLHDFTTLSRSVTLPGPTDNATTIARLAKNLLSELDTSSGVRLLGVGVSGLADWIQDDLFGDSDPDQPPEEAPTAAEPEARSVQYAPGMDVAHDEWGPGWVWGSGRGVVTVRFETAHSPSGPVRSFAVNDPALRRIDPLPIDPLPIDPQAPHEPA